MNTVIGKRILAAVQSGMSIDEAFDFVLGAGSFKALADSLHKAFTA